MKTFIIILLLVIATLISLGYRAFISPKGVEGSKEVTIQVIVEKEGVNESFSFETDTEFLFQLLEEKQAELGFTYEESDYGPMITGMMNYVADGSQNEYFHIYTNGIDATTGAAEIPLNDGDNYKFELKKW